MALPNEDLAREATRPWGEETSTLCRTSISRRTSAGTVPGRGPLAGNYEGVAQVIELFGRIFELSGHGPVSSCTTSLPTMTTPSRSLRSTPSGRASSMGQSRPCHPRPRWQSGRGLDSSSRPLCGGGVLVVAPWLMELLLT